MSRRKKQKPHIDKVRCGLCAGTGFAVIERTVAVYHGSEARFAKPCVACNRKGWVPRPAYDGKLAAAGQE